MDTSAWIISFKASLNPKTKIAIDAFLSESRIVTCGVVMLELLQGAISEAEYRKLFADLSALVFIETNQRIWEASYRIAFEMRRRGNLIPTGDCLITAIALESKLELIHADKHFDAIQKYIPLEASNILVKPNIE